jgi:CBS domain-containing protein
MAVTSDGSENGKLLGIVTSRDYRVSRMSTDTKVKDIMTPFEELIVGDEDTTLKMANDIIWDNKLNSLPIVDKDGNLKYYAVTGSKGYKWLESEMVRTLNKEDDIDTSYYAAMVDTAIDTISKYGDFEWFVSDDTSEPVKPKPPIEQPKTMKVPCGDCKYDTCFDCPKFRSDNLHAECSIGFDIGDYILSNTPDYKNANK